jgi:Uma2 family endonuclease
MSTTSSPATVPVPDGGPGAGTAVPSLDEIYRLTAVSERRVLFPNVEWSFYERLVDSIPESSNIHVDYDGKDLEIIGKGPKHGSRQSLLGRFIDMLTEEHQIDCQGLRDTTWKRPEIARGLEADECYYFLPEKLQAYAAADERGSDDISDYPNPDLAVEVDISEPRVDRPGIYAALRVAEVWRFDGREVVIERLTPEWTYQPVETSQFLPVTAEEVRRWLVDEDSRDQLAWARRLRAEIRKKQG